MPEGHLFSSAYCLTLSPVKEMSMLAGNVIALLTCSDTRAVAHSCSAGIDMMSTPPSIFKDTSIYASTRSVDGHPDQTRVQLVACNGLREQNGRPLQHQP